MPHGSQRAQRARRSSADRHRGRQRTPARRAVLAGGPAPHHRLSSRDVDFDRATATLTSPAESGLNSERIAMSTPLPVTAALYAAILGLLAAGLTVRVILGRVGTGVQAGDGGNAALGQSIRA